MEHAGNGERDTPKIAARVPEDAHVFLLGTFGSFDRLRGKGGKDGNPRISFPFLPRFPTVQQVSITPSSTKL